MAIGIAAKAVLLYAASLVVVGAMLFLPAGTLQYWQAWLYMAVVFVPVAFVGIYFLARDREFLERRFRMREKEKEQQLVQIVGGVIFFVAFLLPGLDRRFGWSIVPPGISVAANAVVLLAYALVFLVFRENSFAGRTVRVVKGQKVISTGPYAFVRHPMYLGVLLMYVATPLALGSYVALPVFLLTIPLLAFRIRNEEEVLRKELEGYKEYCGKVKYRLVPGVW